MSNPVRLHKKEETFIEKAMEKLNEELLKLSYVIVPTLLVLLLGLFVVLCFAMVGASAVESGVYYYHLRGI